MPRRSLLTLFLFALIMSPWQQDPGAQDVLPAANACLQCHLTKQDGFSPAHSFAAGSCVTCHAGNNAATVEAVAHAGLIAFPGELANAQRACGSCHTNRVASVSEHLMHTASGMVHVTRQTLGEPAGQDHTVNLQSLGHGVADSMLRKQCASCHIGQTKTAHRHDVMWDRGGGCLACHINDYPDDSHPSLTVSVNDARCFGCHSRSGRISLSYAGLAEVDVADTSGNSPGLRLPDGRHVVRMSADAHYLAEMSCIDCHTSVGLMGGTGDALHQRQAVDIGCADCHANQSPRIGLSEWPALMTSLRKHIPFAADETTAFLTTAKTGTPLWHLEIREDGVWLHTKNTNRVLRIPAAESLYHTQDQNHERLTCSACHSQWAPQCFGCHMEYDADGEQWDHIDRAVTPGRWKTERWHVSNTLPALGVNDSDQIELFVPGMIMTVAHPEFEHDKFVRMFAPLSPHTTGKSRSCNSCHRSSEALGLGQGKLTESAGERVFEPANALLPDGLPGDAWTNIENSLGGRVPVTGQRPLDRAEMDAILNAPIPD
jgi:hypothetical protein